MQNLLKRLWRIFLSNLSGISTLNTFPGNSTLTSAIIDTRLTLIVTEIKVKTFHSIWSKILAAGSEKLGIKDQKQSNSLQIILKEDKMLLEFIVGIHLLF